ncbi:MAG: lipoprotein-releasing ABC transporter ATP-binding protein LolD [Proteobacteria bacterium]|nr:lipoprotein-releasing ABC transporter ATP-binding protein LolD [Pseudomonadota bacterium]
MRHPDSQAVLQALGVSQTFSDGRLNVEVLKSIDLEVYAGEQIAVVGTSGSGKSTLLHLLGGLSKPTHGEVWVDGQNISTLSAKEQGVLRNHALGFVYQFHHLLPEFSALENVAMPLLIRGIHRSEAQDRAAKLLQQTGLGKRLEHKPGELSGGERQRAAVARALVTQPKCVLADEPTGNLDHQTADHIHGMMTELNQQYRTALVVVTHDRQLAARMFRRMRLVDGVLETD